MSGPSALRGFPLREFIATHLRAAGVDVQARPKDVGSISQRLARMADNGPQPDLLGHDMAGFYVHVRSDARDYWARALDQVEAVADPADLPILIEPKKYAPGDAWVLMSLPTFGRLLTERRS